MSYMRNRKEVDPGYEMGDAVVVKITENALLCNVEGEEFWIPKSQLHERSEVTDATLIQDGGELIVTTWFAGQRGWI